MLSENGSTKARRVRKIGHDAFDVYVAQGPGRSYSAVAKHFGASKVAVTRRAKAEGWQAKLTQVLDAASSSVMESLSSTEAEFRLGTIETLYEVQSRCVDHLKTAKFATAAEAIRALEVCVKLALVLRGVPEKRAHLEIEYQRDDDRWVKDAERTTREHFREALRDAR